MTRKDLLKTIVAAVTGAAAVHGESVDVLEQTVERGKLYVVESPNYGFVSDIREAVRPYEEAYGINILILENGATFKDPHAPQITININSDTDAG